MGVSDTPGKGRFGLNPPARTCPCMVHQEAAPISDFAFYRITYCCVDGIGVSVHWVPAAGCATLVRWTTAAVACCVADAATALSV